MDDHTTEGVASGRVVLELTDREAALVAAALRQYEPFWPDAETDLGRAQLLAGIREAIDHVTHTLDTSSTRG